MKKLALILMAMLTAATCAVAASAAITGNDVTAYGEPVVSSGHPGGSGASIDVIVDGIRPAAETGTNMDQRDTFGGAMDPFEEGFELRFEKDIEFTGVEFTEGMHFVDGGYFSDGSIKVQVLQGDAWVDIKTTNNVGYPVGTTPEAFGANFETYTFEFEPVTGTAIRVTGMAGGNGTIHFASCSELTVYSSVDPATLTTWVDRKAAEEAAAANAFLAAAQVRADTEGFIEQISTPITTYDNMDDNVGGGTKTLSTINDGVFPIDNVDVPQFDTICNTGRWDPYHNEWIGYEFPKTYTVEYVEFYEGGNFFDGGFFHMGEIWLEALIDGEWVEVESDVSPDYPEGETQEEFLPGFDCYTFTLATPTACDGIRVSGTAGGSASFISCSEIIVKATVDAPVVEEPVVEEPVVEEPVVEEPVEEVVEAPAEAPVEEAPVVVAPQTFDAVVIAAVAGLVSLAGYALTKKR